MQVQREPSAAVLAQSSDAGVHDPASGGMDGHERAQSFLVRRIQRVITGPF